MRVVVVVAVFVVCCLLLVACCLLVVFVGCWLLGVVVVVVVVVAFVVVAVAVAVAAAAGAGAVAVAVGVGVVVVVVVVVVVIVADVPNVGCLKHLVFWQKVHHVLVAGTKAKVSICYSTAVCLNVFKGSLSKTGQTGRLTLGRSKEIVPMMRVWLCMELYGYK